MVRLALLLAATTALAADPPAPTRAERWAAFKAARDEGKAWAAEEMKKAKTPEQRDAFLKAMRAKEAARQAVYLSANQALALAEENPADDIACDAATYAVRSRGDAGLNARCRAIFQRHATNPKVAEALYWVAVDSDPADQPFLRRVLTDNPDRLCRAIACNLLAWRAQMHAETAVPDTELTAAVTTARALYRRAADEFGDVTVDGPYRGKLADLAAKALKQLDEVPLVGKPAPDLAGTDLDGHPFALADHRGKVVLVDFWYSGCKPCMAAMPDLKATAERLAGLPFAVVGVNADGRAEFGRAAQTKAGLTWPSLDAGPGAVNGPVAKAWAVEAWPTAYLIGPDGVVMRRLVGKQDPAALNKLLDASVGRVGK